LNNPGRTGDGALVWIAGAVVVAVLAVVAIFAIRSSDSGDDAQEVTVAQTSDVAIGDVPVTEPDDGTTEDRGAEDPVVDPDDVDTDGDEAPDTPTTTAPIDPDVEMLPEYQAGEADAAIGMTIPRLSGKSLSGEDMVIEADGTAKVIVFVAHWCPACQAEVPRIVEHLESNPMPEDVELVAVSTSVQTDAPNYPPSRWLEREGWNVPTLADSELNLAAAYYGLTSFPYFVVADADGTVVGRVAGQISTGQFDQLVAMARG
jgi:thiol-disulfide isomerase/thioredoxin